MHVSNVALRREIRKLQAHTRQNANRRLRRIPATNRRRPQPKHVKPSEELGTMLLAIARGLAERNNFRNYSFIEDAIGWAVIDMLAACRKFDLSKNSSAFCYMTTVCWHRYTRVIQTENRRGIRGAADRDFQIVAVPNLLLGSYDAAGLSDALSYLEG
jgi:hypothetical protein